jgi:hypothetical protein
VLRLNREINAAVNLPDVRERILARRGSADDVLPDFEAMIKKEFESNAQLIKAAGKSH